MQSLSAQYIFKQKKERDNYIKNNLPDDMLSLHTKTKHEIILEVIIQAKYSVQRILCKPERMHNSHFCHASARFSFLLRICIRKY